MDLKKEIKLSDLFRRRRKGPAEATAPAEERPKKARSGLFSFRKPKEGDGAPPREAKPPKEPKEPRRKARRKAAPPLPQVPLMRAFNLLPGDDGRREPGALGDGGARRPTTAQLVLAVVGLLLVAVLASIFLITNATVADKQTELDDLKGRLAELDTVAETPVAPAGDQTLVQEQTNRTGALATALGQRVAWDRVLRELSLVLPEDVWLTTLTATAPDATAQQAAAPPADPAAAPLASTFELGGYTRKQENVAQLLSRISVLPEVAAVQLVSATETGRNVVEFIISATLKPAGAGGTS